MAEGRADLPVYPIGVVEKLTGLSGRRIRYYEATGLVVPARTKGNQRLYSPADVDRLLKVKELLGQGLNIEGVRAVLKRLDGEALAGDEVSPRGDRPTDRQNDALSSEVGEYGDATLDELAVFATGQLSGLRSREMLAAGRRLNSLYPVTNQAELTRILHKRGGLSDSGGAVPKVAGR
ncbi:MAG: MerR family transcriptional regulator [Limnochordales bacterium]|nr:MerR family transcriptional regulator [Limnochordales bacterium]